ncbi:MAG: DUF1501 domain-containing protein [Planctomycetes bacterium]|nr:DUF1501 domain-containing protein [Planctomycetota bacterium]
MTHFAQDDERALIAVFLRGAADGLALVPPVGDDDYHRARPRIAISEREGHKLDGFFALNPALAELQPLFAEGLLSIVHACGSDDDTRSHFEAQDLMEHGGTSVAGGWIGRWLRDAGGNGPLSALAFGAQLPESLRAAPSATALQDLEELRPSDDGAQLRASLAELYRGDELLGASAIAALSAAERIGEIARASYTPEHGAQYAAASDGEPAREFGAGLARIAQLVKARVGVRAATIDLEGWDSHFVQETTIASKLRALALGLSAFARDLGPRLATTSVVVMTEFGRRVGENGSLGTDHGRGGVFFVLGGGTSGGVHCRWPGLGEGSLIGPGDLAVVHDYRDALAAVLARHGAGERLAQIFPARVCTSLPV